MIIGGDHYFRFNHPAGVDLTKRKSSGVPKDFLFAKTEIERTQNERLVCHNYDQCEEIGTIH